MILSLGLICGSTECGDNSPFNGTWEKAAGTSKISLVFCGGNRLTICCDGTQKKYIFSFDDIENALTLSGETEDSYNGIATCIVSGNAMFISEPDGNIEYLIGCWNKKAD